MIDGYLKNCLYFTVNRLSRAITKMAEESFKRSGLSPTHAFLMMVVNDKDGITPTELAETLHMTPSTITRFVDKLVFQGFLERKAEGKNSFIYLTEKGLAVQVDIESAWKELFHRYSEILGEEEGKSLNRLIDEAGEKFEQ